MNPSLPRRDADALVSVAAILGTDAAAAESFITETLDILARNYQYYELLLIDNGSPLEVYFQTQNLQRSVPNLRVVRLSRPYSLEVAMVAALDHCIGDYVVIMDSLGYPPQLIPRLVSRGMEGCDSVAAVVSNNSGGLVERLVAKGLYGLASRVLKFQLRPDESYYRMFTRRLVNSIVKIRSKNRYLSCLNASIGLQQGIITYEAPALRRKHSSLRRILRQMLTVTDILVSNSGAPIRFASILALVACCGDILYLLYILVVSLVKSHLAEGWLTTSLTQTTMFLLLFFILAIVSEYIARILDETKDQPLYFVEAETNSVVSSRQPERLNVIDESASLPASEAAAG
jgi:glycosyltransferase involved in cell wall biosynthesis